MSEIKKEGSSDFTKIITEWIKLTSDKNLNNQEFDKKTDEFLNQNEEILNVITGVASAKHKNWSTLNVDERNQVLIEIAKQLDQNPIWQINKKSMVKEIKTGIITRVENSDLGNAMVYGQMENNDQFGLTTLVPKCTLKQGDVVNIIVNTNEAIPIPGTSDVLTDLPRGVWGNACNNCVHNPYIPKNRRQCAAAKHL